MRLRNMIAIARAEVGMPFDPMPQPYGSDVGYSITAHENREKLRMEHEAFQMVQHIRSQLSDMGIDYTSNDIYETVPHELMPI